MKLHEIVSDVKFTATVKKFIRFSAKYLGLSREESRIKFVSSGRKFGFTSFGAFDPEAKVIYVVKDNRHIADVLRTLAHELVHMKQRQTKNHLDGSDGSKDENEANAKAGILLRKFLKKYPEILE
jgi:Zn-dependent peptidase ImmA (M78 family)